MKISFNWKRDSQIRLVKRTVFWGSLTLAIIFGLSFIYLTYQFWNKEKLVKKNALQLAAKQSQETITKIDNGFEKLIQEGNTIANNLSDGKLSYQDIPAFLETQVKKYPNVTGISVAFKPYAYKEDVKLYAPYAIKSGNKTKVIQIENLYDYTISTTQDSQGPKTGWYTQPLQLNAPTWMEPYYGTASKNLVVDYTLPFYLVNKEHKKENQAGAVSITLSLSDMNRYIASMLLGNTSYGYLVSKEGKILAHPVINKIGTYVEKISNGGKEKEFVDPKTGKNFWMFNLPLKNTQWTIRINLDQEDFLTSPIIKINHLSWMILFGTLSLFFFTIFLFRIEKASPKRLWGFSIISAMIFACGIGFLWHFNLTYMHPASGTKIMDQTALNRYLLFYGNVNKVKPETLIPTGILVQNIYFPTKNRLGISGFIWQKYPKGSTISSPHGFIFPHQIGLTNIKEMTRTVEKNNTLIIWHFDTIVRQNMNPFVYPLDKENIGLRLSSFDPSKNYVLVPDLGGYETLNSKFQPGVSNNIFIEDWIVNSSFFSYKLFSNNSFYGMDQSQLEPKTPELYFNITIARNVMNPLFSYLIPLFLVTCMLFAVFMSGKTTHIISYAGAMLIVITFAHVALRNTLAVQGISYLETFYIVIYPLIVAVTATVLIREANKKIKLLEWHNNLITKILFWPLIFGINFFIALILVGFH